MNATRALVDGMREEFEHRIMTGPLSPSDREYTRIIFEHTLQEGLLKSVEVLTIQGGLK